MAIQTKKKENESFESLLKRFNREVTRSRLLTNARQGRYFEKEPSKNLLRKSALRKAEIRKERKRFFNKNY